MADTYDRFENEGSGGGFMMGLLTGTVLGAGLGMLLAPKAGSELRGAIGEQAKNISNLASDQYRKAADAAGTWAEKGRDFVDRAREAVSRGAEEARGYAGTTTGTGYTGGGYTGGTGSSYGNQGTGGYTGPGGQGNTGGSDFGRS